MRSYVIVDQLEQVSGVYVNSKLHMDNHTVCRKQEVLDFFNYVEHH